MTLREVMGRAAAGVPDVEVRALAFDDRDVRDGTVFFCVRGFSRDGHDFAANAVARGAAALVVDHHLDGLDIPQVVVADVRAAMAPAAAALAGDPTATLETVGITGTNGKTTSAYLIRSLLEAGGHRTGMLGTVTSVVGGIETPTVRTTPEAIDLQRTFAEMLEAGDTHCVMEVSSHALALHRAAAIHWAAAVFTNLTQDHLDFHKDMDDYFAAKRELFVTAASQGAPLVINIDDAHGGLLAAEFGQAVTVAIDAPSAQLRATDVSFGPNGSTFVLDGTAFSCPLPGSFNVLNALGAIAVARGFGIDDATSAAALPQADSAPGRFQPVDEGQDFAVIVDYAHTPDSLENVLRAARSLTDARVLVVFGAGGDRDRGKRPAMGAIAAAGADLVFVTSDNPRSEDPDTILEQIAAGIEAGAARVTVEVDRRRAIEQAVAQAAPRDVVVIAGKGHEEGQEFENGRKIPFDDASVAREALRARLAA